MRLATVIAFWLIMNAPLLCDLQPANGQSKSTMTISGVSLGARKVDVLASLGTPTVIKRTSTTEEVVYGHLHLTVVFVKGRAMQVFGRELKVGFHVLTSQATPAAVKSEIGEPESTDGVNIWVYKYGKTRLDVQFVKEDAWSGTRVLFYSLTVERP